MYYNLYYILYSLFFTLPSNLLRNLIIRFNRSYLVFEVLKSLGSRIADTLHGRSVIGRPRSVGPRIIGNRQAQTQPIFLKQLHAIYGRNYVVRTCVDAVSNDCAKEGHIWERVEGEVVTPEQEAIRDQADRMITYPNQTMTEHDLINANIKDLLVGADSFTEVVWNPLQRVGPSLDKPQVLGATPSQFWPVDGATMYIKPADKTGMLPPPPDAAYEQRGSDAIPIPFTRAEMIHISEGNITGRIYGTPRLLSAIVLLATQMQAIRYNLKTFTGARYPKSMVGVGDIDESALDRLIDKAEKQALMDPHGVMFVNSKELKSLPLIGTNRDMEFMALQKFVERSVCAVFRTPPIRIGIAEAGGAGIVVGHTQMQTYWDGIEELQRQWSEQYNFFFKVYMGLKAFRLKLKSGRPELYSEQATIEDLQIKNGTKTVNEFRSEHGRDPVPWGDQPPVAASAAPGALSLPQGPDVQQALQPSNTVLHYEYDTQKAVAPGRMQDSPLVDPAAQKIKERTRSRLAGSWLRTRVAMLDVLNDVDVVTSKSSTNILLPLEVEKARIMTLDELEAELDKILGSWEEEALAITAEGNADSYAMGRTAMAKDLEVEGELPAFDDLDAERLRGIQESFAANPIRSFKAEQTVLIQQAIFDAQADSSMSTFKVRERLEENMNQLTREETFKLDRIVRTTVHQANSSARLKAMDDSGIDKVRFITANDRRVRKTHKEAGRRGIIPLTEARKLLREINCRCRAVKPARKIKGVPSPDALAQAIIEDGVDARTAARASLEV